MTTKISKSRLGDMRFPKHDKPPFDNSVKTYNLSPEELKKYLKNHEKKRGRKMKPEQAQELENSVNLEDELKKLEQEVMELSETNKKLKFLLDDIHEKYNRLSLDYETANQVKYDLTRTEGQRDQLKLSLKETEEILFKEVDKRETLERALKLYLP